MVVEGRAAFGRLGEVERLLAHTHVRLTQQVVREGLLVKGLRKHLVLGRQATFLGHLVGLESTVAHSSNHWLCRRLGQYWVLTFLKSSCLTGN